MKAGVTVAILVAISLPRLVRAQASSDATPVVLLHPRVATIFQLPDQIEHARILDRDEIRFAVLGDKLYVRPRAGTAAGVEALLEVETRTVHQTFRLRVVARARDARLDVLVPPVEAQAPGESKLGAPPEVPAEPEASPEVPTPAEPAPCAPGPAPPPVEPALSAPEPVGAADDERATVAAMSPRVDRSVHAVVGLGFTGLELAGHVPGTALRSQRSLGVRLTSSPLWARWLTLEVQVGAEWISGAMKYEKKTDDSRTEVTGPWLRTEVGARTRLGTGTPWIPSVYAGIGVQAQLRRSKQMDIFGEPQVIETMPEGIVMALGIGLHYQARDVLLGMDFQTRRGGPDDYRSVAVLWTIGYSLDQGGQNREY